MWSHQATSSSTTAGHVVNPWEAATTLLTHNNNKNTPPPVVFGALNPWMQPVANTDLQQLLSSRAKLANAATTVQGSDPHAFHVPAEWCVEMDTTMYRPKNTGDRYATRFEYVGLCSWLAENVIEPPVVTDETDAIKIAEAILKAGTRLPGEKVTTGGVPIFFPRVTSRYGEGKRTIVSWDQLLRDDSIWIDVDDE